MKHKAADLTGVLLDAAVALACGWTIFRNKRDGFTIRSPDGIEPYVHFEVGNHPPKFDSETGKPVAPISISEAFQGIGYMPSADYTDGGSIIDNELIATTPVRADDGSVVWYAWVEAESLTDENCGYYERGLLFPDEEVCGRGPTRLIAAMRAFVAHKFGDEVDMP